MLLFLPALLGGAPATAQEAPRDGADPAVLAVIERHVASLGGNEALAAAGDLVIWTTVERGGTKTRFRTFVRREPFAIREESLAEDGSTGPFLAVSDGRYVWRPRGDGSGEPLPAAIAVPTLEFAFFEAFLYLETARASAQSNGRWVLEPDPGLPEGFPGRRDVDVVGMKTPAGTGWVGFFDAEDGRRLGLQTASEQDTRWVRYADWRDFDGLHLPSRLGQGNVHTPERTITVVDRVETRVEIDDGLFAGRPESGPDGVARAADLLVVRDLVPGWGRIVIPEVRVNGKGPVAAVYDTGAPGTFLSPEFARSVPLAVIGHEPVMVMLGSAVAGVTWIDRLEIGEHLRVQTGAYILTLPLPLDLPERLRTRVTFGGGDYLASCPLFDFEGRTLFFRGAPVTPLRNIAKEHGRSEDAVDEVAYRIDGWAMSVPIEVEGKRLDATLDTGIEQVVRLSRRALDAAGLPTDKAEWRKRGAIPCPYGGAGAIDSGWDLLARLDRVRIGRFVFERPYVLLAGMGGDGPVPDTPFDALLGAGAITRFARVGIDASRNVVELEPGAGWVRDEDGTSRTREDRVYLGLVLNAPVDGALREPEALPRVGYVIEHTPAHRAGVRTGDYLLSIDGIPVLTQSQLHFAGELMPEEGRRVALLFLRPGAPMFGVTLP